MFRSLRLIVFILFILFILFIVFVSSTQWDLTTASYVQGIDIGATSPSLRDGFMNPGGTKIYIADTSNNDVDEYALSVAFNVSTMSYTDNIAVTGSQGIFIKADGTEMYVCESNVVYQYTISTPWDISTGSYIRSFDISAKEASCVGLSFKTDGTIMYTAGNNGDAVDEWALSDGWNISSTVWTREFSVNNEETSIQGMFMKPDGTKMFIVGQGNDEINEYGLSIAWNVSSATSTYGLNISGEDINSLGLFFNESGTKMYMLGYADEKVHEYTLPYVAVDTCTCAGAGNNWEIDMSDGCNITDACDLTTGTLSFTGAGWCNCNASVDTTNLGDPGATGILYIQDSCLITID